MWILLIILLGVNKALMTDMCQSMFYSNYYALFYFCFVWGFFCLVYLFFSFFFKLPMGELLRAMKLGLIT